MNTLVTKCRHPGIVILIWSLPLLQLLKRIDCDVDMTCFTRMVSNDILLLLLLLLLKVFIWFWGSRDGIVVRALESPPTNVAWVRFPDTASYVG